MNIQIFLQVLTFLATNRDVLKQVVLTLQSLLPDSPGADKASAVKSFIAKTLDIEAQIEAVWPAIAPFFNMFVCSVKTTVQKVA